MVTTADVGGAQTDVWGARERGGPHLADLIEQVRETPGRRGLTR